MLPNLVKYCVDCFSLLFSVLVRVGYISSCICLRLVDSSERWLPGAHAQQDQPMHNLSSSRIKIFNYKLNSSFQIEVKINWHMG